MIGTVVVMRRTNWGMILIFGATFFALQLGWERIAATALGHWVVDDATVRTAVALINAVVPGAGAHAAGVSILSPCCRLNLRNGCEGTELLFLLLAGLAAYPFSAGARAMGLLSGTALMFMANQLRALALYLVIRYDTGLFEPIHGLVAPLLLTVCCALFFAALLRWDLRRCGSAHA